LRCLKITKSRFWLGRNGPGAEDTTVGIYALECWSAIDEGPWKRCKKMSRKVENLLEGQEPGNPLVICYYILFQIERLGGSSIELRQILSRGFHPIER
jgi:hypothetical protein